MSACPTVHRPFAQGDGYLLRLRVPGGILSSSDAATVAGLAAEAGAAMEITSRANLQLRGLDGGAAGDLAEKLVAAGLAPADAVADGRRNVLASPAAGLDPTELFDTRSLVTEVVELLAAGPAVSPKFGVVIDGGGAISVRGRRHDLALGAVRGVAGDVRLEVRTGAALPVAIGPDEPIPTVPVADGAAVVAAALEMASPTGGRLGCVPVEDLAGAAGVELTSSPVPAFSAFPSAPPLGDMPGLGAVGVLPLLGRLAPGDLARLAGWSEEVRLTPWRSLLLVGMDAARLAALGDDFVVSPRDPGARVVACAGLPGCPSARADTQADGRRVATSLRSRPTHAFAPTSDGTAIVHLSGCEKRCAGRGGDEATFVAASPGRYALAGGSGEFLTVDQVSEALGR